MTPRQVLHALYRSSDAWFAARSGGARDHTVRPLQRFDATAKNGDFGPTRSVVRRPAWLVVIAAVLMIDFVGRNGVLSGRVYVRGGAVGADTLRA